MSQMVSLKSVIDAGLGIGTGRSFVCKTAGGCVRSVSTRKLGEEEGVECDGPRDY